MLSSIRLRVSLAQCGEEEKLILLQSCAVWDQSLLLHPLPGLDHGRKFGQEAAERLENLQRQKIQILAGDQQWTDLKASCFGDVRW